MMSSFKPFQVQQQTESTKSVQTEWESWSFAPINQAATLPVSEAQLQPEFEQQSELKKIREEARQQAFEQGLAEGKEQGYQAGHAQGLEEGQREGAAHYEQQLQQALEPLAQLLTAADQAVTQMSEHISESLMQLALTVGRQLAGEALEANPEQVLQLIRAIMHEDAMLTENPVLVLNPDDLDLVQTQLQQELKTLNWKLRADDRIQRGGCRLMSENGEIDATIESRWQRVVQQFRGGHG